MRRAGNRVWRSLAWIGAACCAFVLLGVPAAPLGAAVPFAASSALAESVAAQQELAAFASGWAHVTAYKATVTVFEQNGENVQNVVLDYTFRKPSNVTVHVAAGPNAGVTLSWGGGTTVIARRGSGLASLFKKTLSLHDPLATTIRGSSIDELSFGAILAHAQDTAGLLSAAKADAIDGSSTTSVTLEPSVAATDAALTKEIIEISATTHLPMRVLGYAGTALVRKVDFSNVTFQE
jgi:outer membrane lipoprotein-sorting protein